MSDLNDPRVLFAAERTLLAWNRTSISLMAFGFLLALAGDLWILRGLLAPAGDGATVRREPDVSR